MQSQLQQLMVAVLTIQTALKLIHRKTRNSCLRCSSTGANVDISMSHYRYAWQDSDLVIFLLIEGTICCLVFGTKESPHMQLRHCAGILAVKTLFKYNLKETIHIYNLIKQYLKHEKIWRLLKQKVMLISREVIIKRPRQETNRQTPTAKNRPQY